MFLDNNINPKTEKMLSDYYEKMKRISLLQKKLDLLSINIEAAQRCIDECEQQNRNSGPEYEGLKQEIYNYTSETISIGTSIRAGQRELIIIHSIVESLPEEEKKTIELRYRKGLSFEKMNDVEKRSNSATRRRIIKILASIEPYFTERRDANV
jgi:DNA-directed RNA polymerase specialized sigma24 family protein